MDRCLSTHARLHLKTQVDKLVLFSSFELEHSQFLRIQRQVVCASARNRVRVIHLHGCHPRPNDNHDAWMGRLLIRALQMHMKEQKRLELPCQEGATRKKQIRDPLV